MVDPGPISFANPAVLEFYKTLPFNIRESVEASVEAIRQTDHVSAYPVLRPLLRRGVRVLDVGCGTGWFSNSLAYHYNVAVTGLDFNPVAVERAREVAAAMKLSTVFIVADLFRFEPSEPFDLVVSLGVLHHTDNCQAAVRRVCNRFVRPGGHVLIGLYHAFGRKPLRDHFQVMKDRGATEEEMLERYRQLHSQIKDETLLVSWFRDQVLHPHETQHTMAEMMPILKETGMELVATSINHFQPIESLAALFEEEKKYHDLAVQRLKDNQYFTGFFIFLARKQAPARSNGAGQAARRFGLMSKDLDTKPYVEYHSLFGYRYIPGADMELPRPGGGSYHILVNSQGIRSDREYQFQKPPGVQRIVVCGDSMVAGQFISNANRFSELMERRLPKLEVLNLALEGSGTDQQLLLYEHVGLQYEHDLVLLLPFLQNIRRNMVEAREAIDPKTGQIILRAKPRYELVEGKLVLRNTPVPKEVSARAIEESGGTDAPHWLRAMLSAAPGAALFKRALSALAPWEPFPEYGDPHGKEWQLMAALIRRFKELAGNRPLVLAPTIYASYVRFRMARNYWDRYASLAAPPGIHVIDLLPYFRRLGADALRCFQLPHDMHLSAYGHLVVAEALQEELVRRGLLPAAQK